MSRVEVYLGVCSTDGTLIIRECFLVLDLMLRASGMRASAMGKRGDTARANKIYEAQALHPRTR